MDWIDEKKNVIKICDFGSALRTTEPCTITPVLVSRFYRPPEIMLGLEYNEAVDMWSVGCILYELCTGKILFRGCDNNDMLRLQMELCGPIPNKMLKKAKYVSEHFDRHFVFQHIQLDPCTKKEMRKPIRAVGPTMNLDHMLSRHRKDDDTCEISPFPPNSPNTQTNPPPLPPKASFLTLLGDLIRKCLVLDPARRWTAKRALLHPFFK